MSRRSSAERNVLCAFILVLVVLLSVSFKHCLSYLLLSDPGVYLGMANKFLYLLADDPASALEGLGKTAPGFPLMLAFMMKLFGPEAAIWLNFWLSIPMVVLFVLFLERMMKDIWATLLMASASIYFFWAGSDSSMFWLLQPFRLTPMLLFVFAGMLTGYACVESRKPIRLALIAGCCFLMGIAVRETSALFLAGPVLHIAFTRGSDGPSRRKILSALLAPIVLGGVLLICGWFVVGSGFNNQLGDFFSSIVQHFHSPESGEQKLSKSFAKLPGLFSSVFSVYGLGLLMAGILLAVRRPLMLAYLLLPAGLLLSVYLLDFLHFRYFSRVIFLLGPFIGFSVFTLLRWLSRLGRSNARKWLQTACVVFCIAFLAGAFRMASRAESLTEPVTSESVQKLRELLNNVLKPTDRIIVEKACYKIGSAIDTYRPGCSWPLPTAEEIHSNTARYVFLRPVNEEARQKATANNYGVQMQASLEDRADLIPMLNGMGDPQMVEFQSGVFELMELRPWRMLIVEQSVAVKGGKPATLLLNFKSLPGNTTCLLELSDPKGDALIAPLTLSGATGWQFVGIPHVPEGAGRLQLRISSERPLPADFEPSIARKGHGFNLSLEQDRKPSTLRFLDRILRQRDVSLYGGLLTYYGKILLPVIRGETPFDGFSIRLTLSAANAYTGPGVVEALQGGSRLASKERVFRRKRPFHLYIPLPLSRYENMVDFDLLLTSKEPEPVPLRLHGIGIEPYIAAEFEHE